MVSNPKHSLILTRTEDEGYSWAQALGKRGVDVRFMPVQTYAPLDPPKIKVSAFQVVLFTSRNAVEHFAKAYPEAVQRKISCAAVGQKTSAVAEETGFKVDLVATQEKAEGLARELVRRYPKNMKMLLPCSTMAREELPDILGKAGFSVTVVPLYEPVAMEIPGDLNERLAEATDILFFAPSQARMFFTWVKEPPASLTYWAIGTTTLKEIPAALNPRALEKPEVNDFIKLLKAEG
jgi:uroporphyrinogen-III synthase